MFFECGFDFGGPPWDWAVFGRGVNFGNCYFCGLYDEFRKLCDVVIDRVSWRDAIGFSCEGGEKRPVSFA